MIQKIKTLIAKVKRKWFYSRCYNNMECIAVAVFGMCSGATSVEYKKTYCKYCPYYTPLNEYKGGAE